MRIGFLFKIINIEPKSKFSFFKYVKSKRVLITRKSFKKGWYDF